MKFAENKVDKDDKSETPVDEGWSGDWSGLRMRGLKSSGSTPS